MIRRSRGRCVCAWVLVSSALVLSCSTVPNGPSLTNVTFSPAINETTVWKAQQRPTVIGLDGKPDPTVCCCHITGTITNRNSVPVYALVQFAAVAPNGDQLSRSLFYAPDLRPGQTTTIEAPPASADCLLNAGSQANGEPILNKCAGFLLPCASIDHVNYQINVSSAGAPPTF
jgi:hypothetical protein